MTILSSRHHSCINPTIKQESNVIEACRNLLLTGVCEYDQPRKKNGLARSINKLDASGAWDLEDFVSALSEVPSCPYFCARKLVKTADIVFCPYSYLLDPLNRSATDIDLKGDIVIIDEAHNVEDASREAASFKITELQLMTSKENLKNLVKDNVEPMWCNKLITMIDGVLRLMQLTRSRLVLAGEFAEPTQVWTGQEISGFMGAVGLGPEKLSDMQNTFRMLATKISESSDRVDHTSSEPKLTAGCIRLFESLFTALRYMFRNDQRNLADYRVVLMETVGFERQLNESLGDQENLHSWLAKRPSKSRLIESRELSLNFWCLNPSVVFSELATEARCVILVSGTLSPLGAMEAELGVPFPIRLEANHVISKDRVLVGTLSHGPHGSRICGNYQQQNTFTFQDEVGLLILEACRLVPGGVLCFLASYGLLDKLIQRWETTDLLSQLRQVKHVMVEPRSSVGLDLWLREFYSTVDDSCNQMKTRHSSGLRTVHSDSPVSTNGTKNGVVVFAVCRGKVSEGMDFSDAYARLVVTIGIPYPAFNNPLVRQKREFNDSALRASSSSSSSPARFNGNVSTSSPSTTPTPFSPPDANARSQTVKDNENSKHVLSGSEWYDAQAYRALNQAIGRCIRHLNDWGAVLLVDARFVEQPSRYMSGISRWIRSRTIRYTDWISVASQLENFIKNHQLDTKAEHEAQDLEEIFAV